LATRRAPAKGFRLRHRLPPSPGFLGARRVAPGSCPPGAPTDPGVRDSRTRLFEKRVRYATR
jgi:hypothetical protein